MPQQAFLHRSGSPGTRVPAKGPAADAVGATIGRPQILLSKICRRKAKPRHLFFLLSEIL
jgi:hypothetical protein